MTRMDRLLNVVRFARASEAAGGKLVDAGDLWRELSRLTGVSLARFGLGAE